jgi:hypothetical protein
MRKIKPLRYTAQVGEQINIVVTPVGMGVFVAAALDGNPLTPTNPTTAPDFQFSIGGPVDSTHFVEMEFSFPGAGSGARYDVAVSGSNGGSDSFTVSKDDSVKDKGLRFKATA